MNAPRRIGTAENPSHTRNLLVEEFLSCQHLLSDDEVLAFLSGGEPQGGDESLANDIDERLMDTWRRHQHDSCDEHFHLRQAYYRRKAEIRRLSVNLRNGLGGARIDQDGRLVPSTQPPQPPRANLPPLNNNANDNNNNNRNNNNNPNANDNPQFFPENNLNNLQPEQQEQLFLEQRRLDTEFAIAHAVRELRRPNRPDGPVPEEDFEVILLDQRGRPSRAANGVLGAAVDNNNMDENNHDNNTPIMNPFLRRIAFGGFTMIALIVCIFVKVLPIGAMFSAEGSSDKRFDPLLNKVLVVREWKDHIRDCPGGLQNRNQSHYDPKWEWLHKIQGSTISADCSDGVLHIPSKHVLQSNYAASSVDAEKDLREYQNGVDLSWFMPCSEHSLEDSAQQQCDMQDIHSKESPGQSNENDQSEQPTTCPTRRNLNRCFRGVHDNFVGDGEIHQALAMGDFFAENGGDHFDVYQNVGVLNRMVPSIVKKVGNLLSTAYLSPQLQNTKESAENEQPWTKTSNIRPVAFRILTTGPMDGHDVKLKQEKGDKMTMYLTQSTALNEAKYLNWVLKSRKHNDKALYQSYYLPWFYRLAPKRETCDLKFDMQADSRFCVQTSLFLTDGAGVDYRGGTNLFVDDHPSNFRNPSHRIARGLSIDGSKGRLIVSSGGLENLRCRFPTRAGFRTVLQIWWDC